MKSKIKAYLPYLRNIYTALFASLSAWFFSGMLLNAYKAAYISNEVEMLDIFYRAFYTSLFPLVVIFAVIMVFYYFDNLDLYNKKDYFNQNQRDSLLSKGQYIISFAIAMLFSTLIFETAYHMAFSFFLPEINPVVSRAVAVVTMAAIRLIQLHLLKDKWDMEIDNPLFVEKAVFKRNRDMNEFKWHQLLWQPLGYFVVFYIIAAMSSLFIFPLFIAILNIIINPQMLVMTLSVTAIVILSIYIVRITINMKKRKILLKHFKNLQEDGIASVKTKGSKILSAALSAIPFTATVTDTEGKVYNCLIVTCGKINAPMYFKDDEYMVEYGMHMRGGALLARGGSYGQIVDIRQLGGKENPTNLVLGFRVAHKIKFPKIEGEKIIIVNPTPTSLYAVDNREFKIIDNGDKVHDYTVFTATVFFNHLERDRRLNKNDD